MHSAPILHTDAKLGGKINRQYAYTAVHTDSRPEDATSSLLPARQQLVISAQNESFERTENPVDTQPPPPHVIDYWFDQLGLSSDLAFSENPLNATGSPFQFPISDGMIYVSQFCVVRPPSDWFMLCGDF